MPDPPRRFPAPWRANRIPGGYVVRDANGLALAYIYARDTEGEARQAKVLTKHDGLPSTSPGCQSYCTGRRTAERVAGQVGRRGRKLFGA
jgi:hypothetical protein